MINFFPVDSFSKKKQFLLSEFYLKERGVEFLKKIDSRVIFLQTLFFFIINFLVFVPIKYNKSLPLNIL